MTTLENTTITDIIKKTSFKFGSGQAQLLLQLMAHGRSFIQALRMTKIMYK